MEVGAGAGLARVARRADPEQRVAARADLADHRLAGMAATEPRDAPRLAVGIGAVGDVDVEQVVSWCRRIAQHMLDDAARDARCRVELEPALLDLRERDRRNPEQEAFHRRRDRPRVQRVVAHVGTLVDAGDDEIGTVLEQPGKREMDAVGRRPVDVAVAVGGLRSP